MLRIKFFLLQPKTKKAKTGGASTSSATSDEDLIAVSTHISPSGIFVDYLGFPSLINLLYLLIAVCKKICECARVQGETASQYPGVL